MYYREVYGDLFAVRAEYVIAHCISEDCEMGKGIATEFVRRNPNMRSYLLSLNPKVGQALFYEGEDIHHVFNLITKKKYNGKPTRASFNTAIRSLKEEMLKRGLRKLAIPLLGSGLDKLNWVQSSQFIQKEFSDTNIQIFVIRQ